MRRNSSAWRRVTPVTGHEGRAVGPTKAAASEIKATLPDGGEGKRENAVRFQDHVFDRT